MIELVLVLWYISGVISFIYWWTNDEDFTGSCILLALPAGLMGPVAFTVGLLIHGKLRNAILIKKRN